ncbi:MAG TPA: hypothetical protein VJZ04_07510 [Lachnospiraceae bacterium]|nr:hypothetical protein [Lachnospiraceae bacterium]
MTPKEALEVGNKVWTGYRVVTLKENHRIDSTTKWWHIEEDNFEYREDRFEKIPIYVQNLLKALTELEELKRYPMAEEVAHYDVFLIIRKALTPPTADEVCEALSGWFDEKFYYDVNQKEFYTKALNGQHSVVKLKKNEIHFGGWYTMPPHLITLIGRFYEGLEKVGNEE